MKQIIAIILLVLVLDTLTLLRAKTSVPNPLVENERFLQNSLLKRLRLEPAAEGASFDSRVRGAYVVGTPASSLMTRISKDVAEGGLSDDINAIILEINRNRVTVSAIEIRDGVRYRYSLSLMFDKEKQLRSVVHGLSFEAWHGP